MQPIRLSLITINNLRSIIRESFPLSDFTALIGYNNAGKTNILMGCRWLLSRYSLPIGYFNDPSLPVEVEGVIEGLVPELIDKLDPVMATGLRPWIKNGRIVVMRRQRIPGEPPDHMEFCVLRPGPERGEREWVVRPPGLEEIVHQLFPTPIQISDNLIGEEHEGHSPIRHIVGKLIAEILKPLEKRYAEKIDATLESLKNLLDMDGEYRAEELISFDRNLNQKLEPLFPSVRIKLQIPSPNLHDIFRQGSLKVVEEVDGFVREVESLGMGAQRAIQMALIRHLSEARKHHTSPLSRTLLLIDSPELFLHPQAVELVRSALKNLSREGFQVIFATHSAQMVTSEDVSSSLLIRKNKLRGTYMRKRMEDAVRMVVQDAPSQLQMLFSLSNSNELLFADYVLLTEGKTELRILPHLFEMISGESFALIKCALVRQGGVSNTRKSMQVLSAMDLPVRAIVDLDYAFTGAAFDGFLDREDGDIDYCKNLFRSLAVQERLRLVNGLPVTRHSSVSASDAYAMLATMPEAQRSLQNIHQKLLRKKIWVWTGGAIEQHLGLEGKNEHVWSAFIERLRRTHKPEREIPDWQGITALVRWIQEGTPRE
jgi:hypothetical protein